MALNEKGRTTERVIIRQFFSKILAWVIFSCLFIYRNGTQKSSVNVFMHDWNWFKEYTCFTAVLGGIGSKNNRKYALFHDWHGARPKMVSA